LKSELLQVSFVALTQALVFSIMSKMMHHRFLTRASLESLTTSELVKQADLYGLDIPPDLNRLFIIEELLEFAKIGGDEDHQYPLEGALVMESGFREPVPLPKQYNITFIKVMIRDPLWAFVFWEVKGFDKEVFEKAPDFGGYYLKVSPWEGGGSGNNHTGEEVFVVPVETGDSARYLGFSPEEEAEADKENRQKVELCAKRSAGEIVLAVSNPFRLPSLPRLPAGRGQEENCPNYKNSLVRLSGCSDFHILRNPDRLHRSKKNGNFVVR
jgi:hypothetical protein